MVLATLFSFAGSPSSIAQSIPVGSTADDHARLLLLLAGNPSRAELGAPLPSSTLRPLAASDYRLLLRAASLPAALQSAHPAPPIDSSAFSSRAWWLRDLSGAGWTFGSRPGREPAVRVHLHPLEWGTSYNTARPSDHYDGAVWQGKGATTWVRAGFSVSTRFLSIDARPTAFHAANQPFPPPAGRTPDPENPQSFLQGYPISRGIDVPYRFGLEAYSAIDPGHSAIRLHAGPLQIGATTAPQWWAPALRHPMVAGNHSAGIPRLFAATRRPLSLPGRLGALEGSWFYGWPEDTPYFRTDFPSIPLLTGAMFALTTGRSATTTVGGTWVLQTTSSRRRLSWEQFRDVYYFVGRGFRTNVDQNAVGKDDTKNMFSLFVRKRLPGIRAELYAEIMRDDAFYDLRDLAAEPNHSTTYQIGFHKLFLHARPGRLTRLQVERTQQASNFIDQVRPQPTSYVYGLQTGGYTHKGQIMGMAGLPGSNAFHLRVDHYLPRGAVGVSFEHRNVGDGELYERLDRQTTVTSDVHAVNLAFGLHALWTSRFSEPATHTPAARTPASRISNSPKPSRRLPMAGPRLMVRPELLAIRMLNESSRPGSDVWNLHLQLTTTYSF